MSDWSPYRPLFVEVPIDRARRGGGVADLSSLNRVIARYYAPPLRNVPPSRVKR